MIVIALGSNRNGPWGTPEESVRRAFAHLNRSGLRLKRASPLLLTRPFGRTDQAPFVNAVAIIETALTPASLLARLHAIERLAGRRRTLRWGPRTLDLDLIDYNGRIALPPSRPILPHPGLADRIFVLQPLAAIAPRWRHPVCHQTAAALLKHLDPGAAGGLL